MTLEQARKEVDDSVRPVTDASVIYNLAIVNYRAFVTERAICDRIIAAADALEYHLKIYDHAHSTGNSVPPHLVASCRAALADFRSARQ